mmetsp:Transcript_105799/g.187303  ORF Transcript_105799/g.187303 Transcript_105799/m.187303 type:complete len:469 (+) Transcript_105799:3-1409(+)
MQKGEVVRLECQPQFRSSSADHALKTVEAEAEAKDSEAVAEEAELRPPWAEVTSNETDAEVGPATYEVELLSWSDEPSKKEVDDALSEAEWENFQQIQQMRAKKRGNGSSGEGNGFRWKESDREITLRLPVIWGLTAKDIEFKVKKEWMRLSAGNVSISGKLIGTVDIDECYWVFDDDAKDGHVVEVTLFKADNSVWAGVFNGEPEVIGRDNTTEAEDDYVEAKDVVNDQSGQTDLNDNAGVIDDGETQVTGQENIIADEPDATDAEGEDIVTDHTGQSDSQDNADVTDVDERQVISQDGIAEDEAEVKDVEAKDVVTGNNGQGDVDDNPGMADAGQTQVIDRDSISEDEPDVKDAEEKEVVIGQSGQSDFDDDEVDDLSEVWQAIGEDNIAQAEAELENVKEKDAVIGQSGQGDFDENVDVIQSGETHLIDQVDTEDEQEVVNVGETQAIGRIGIGDRAGVIDVGTE